jgi:hypothetical protein|tara:strand:- start:1276 stop:2199 length:924 start_codon:yes stop_codon:yes gene_type:complete
MNDDLRVHTDADGIVWCGQHGVGAYCTGDSPDEFVTKNVFKTAPVVRAMGSSENSKLLLAMYERHKKAPVLAKRQVLLASPMICHTEKVRADPEEVLYRLWQSDTTARVSANWHLMRSVDFNAYLLHLAVLDSKYAEGVTDKAKIIFQYHPAFNAISFFENVDVDSVVSLLSSILDPRWYVHAERPNRLSKLLCFLGLTIRNFDESSATLGGYNYDRACMVHSSWSGLDRRPVDYTSPRSFLWRIYRHHGGGDKGSLRASEAFMRFVTLHWLQGLSGSSRRLFDPSLFFKTNDEVVAYNTHMTGIRS